MNAISITTINTVNGLRASRNNRSEAEQKAEQRNSLFRECSAHNALGINALDAVRNNGTRFQKNAFSGAEQPSICSAVVPLTTCETSGGCVESGTTEQLEKKFPPYPPTRARLKAPRREPGRDAARRAVPSWPNCSSPAREMVALSETVGHFAKLPAEAGLS